MCVAILDLSHSVLAMDFSPRLSFGCFNYQAFPSQLKSATRPRGNGFFRRLRNIWFGHSKAITLS